MNEYVAKVAEQVGASAEEIRKYFGEEYITEEYKKEAAMELIANAAVVVEEKK